MGYVHSWCFNIFSDVIGNIPHSPVAADLLASYDVNLLLHHIQRAQSSIVLRSPVAAWSVDKRQDGSMFSCCFRQSLTQLVNDQTRSTSGQHLPGHHQSRQSFSNLLLSRFGESVPNVASFSCSKLTGAASCLFFCCCRPPSLWFNAFCLQR